MGNRAIPPDVGCGPTHPVSTQMGICQWRSTAAWSCTEAARWKYCLPMPLGSGCSATRPPGRRHQSCSVGEVIAALAAQHAGDATVGAASGRCSADNKRPRFPRRIGSHGTIRACRRLFRAAGRLLRATRNVSPPCANTSAVSRASAPATFRSPRRGAPTEIPIAGWSADVDSSFAVLTIWSSDTDDTRRSNSVSTRNAGVPVSNQCAANLRRRSSSSTSYGSYTFSSPIQL